MTAALLALLNAMLALAAEAQGELYAAASIAGIDSTAWDPTALPAFLRDNREKMAHQQDLHGAVKVQAVLRHRPGDGLTALAARARMAQDLALGYPYD